MQTIDLLTLAWQGNEPVNGSGTSTASRQPAGITVAVVDPGAVSAPAGQTPVTLPPGQIMEIVQPGSDMEECHCHLLCCHTRNFTQH